MKLPANITVDDLQFYLAKGAELHPHTQQFFLQELTRLQWAGKVSLTPSTILERYTLRFPRKVVNG